MAKNIGFSKRIAHSISKMLNEKYGDNLYVDAYPQKQLHWRKSPVDPGTYQWIVVVQKKPDAK